MKDANILLRTRRVYIYWLKYLPYIDKISRNSLGQNIDLHLLDLIKNSYKSYYSSAPNKTSHISRAINNLNEARYLLLLSWEAKVISHGFYANISESLVEIGNMLGGWKKSLENKKNALI